MKARLKTAPLTPAEALYWILCLACLAVGARNFETGIAVDANTYAQLARTVARSGEWFWLVGSTQEFTPFAEHPHLGFWLLGLVFKVLPAADWSGRIVGHFFYVAFLLVFFLHLRRKADERTAVAAVLLLWVWAPFSNFFSNIYLDPGCLFFGFSAIAAMDLAFERRSRGWALAGGLGLGLAAMYKGLTVLGFCPAVAATALFGWKGLGRRKWLELSAVFVATCALTLAAYYVAIRCSRVPDFLSLYFHRQWLGRFARSWNWANVFGWTFWGALFKASAYTLPLALLALPHRTRGAWIPWLLLLTFALMYAPANRFGVNYWVTVLPWVAWLVASVLAKPPWKITPVVKWTGRFAIFAVVLIQYFPVRTHGSSPAPELVEIERLKQAGRTDHLWVDFSPEGVDFTIKDSYLWNTDLQTNHLEHQEAVPKAMSSAVLIPVHPSPNRNKAYLAAGWCDSGTFGWRSIWRKCGQGAANAGSDGPR